MLIGTAVKDITPEIGTELSGFAVRKQPSDHIIDPLFCKVIYMEKNGFNIFWIQLDLIGVEMAFVQKVRARISDKLYVPESNIIIAATHTHSGPGTLPLNFCGEYRPDYLSGLEDDIERCCEQSAASPETCLPMYGKVPLELAIDRREGDQKKIDPYMKYLAWTRPDKTVKAILWNYAMHPVCLKGTGISADYPGSVCGEVSENLPGNPVAVFGLGACGNINPPEAGVDPAVMKLWAKKISETLTEDVLKRLCGFDSAPDILQINNTFLKLKSPLISHEAIGAYAKRFREDPGGALEFGPVFTKAIEKWEDNMMLKMSQLGIELPVEIFCLTIGDTKLLGVSAEVFSSLVMLVGQDIEEDFMIITCVNGTQGYLPDLHSYEKGGYETHTSCFFYNQLPPFAGSLEKVANGLGELMSVGGNEYN